jgi:hypothetical protein
MGSGSANDQTAVYLTYRKRNTRATQGIGE